MGKTTYMGNCCKLFVWVEKNSQPTNQLLLLLQKGIVFIVGTKKEKKLEYMNHTLYSLQHHNITNTQLPTISFFLLVFHGQSMSLFPSYTYSKKLQQQTSHSCSILPLTWSRLTHTFVCVDLCMCGWVGFCINVDHLPRVQVNSLPSTKLRPNQS